MNREELARVTVPESGTILDALKAIDAGGAGMCCVTDPHGVLVAVITDGDARRALINGSRLSDRACPVANSNPITAPEGQSRALVLDLMKASRVDAVPEVDQAGRLVALHTLSDILGVSTLPNCAVIMAGGKGTRLGALTRDTPKPLMTVGGRTILEGIILSLVRSGIRTVYVSVNHMAERVTDHLGDGTRFGCQIHYLRESPELPLGTAGSLTLLPESVTTESAPPIIVLNGDLLVDFDARDLLRHHSESSAVMTMGTKIYQHSVPFGVVEVDQNRRLTEIVEKPEIAVEVNAAIYCLDAPLVNLLPKGAPSTMPELARMCIDAGSGVTAWMLNSDWIDIGTPEDLARAKGER